MNVSSLICIFCEKYSTDLVERALPWSRGALGLDPPSATCLLFDLGEEIFKPQLFLSGNIDLGDFLRSLNRLLFVTQE